MNETPVTVLGLGAMGTALARVLLDHGHPVTVWNRSPGKGDDLVERGARRAATAAQAVTASPLTVVCVTDYPAVRKVLGAVGDAVAGRTLVNLTTGTPAQARDTAAWAGEHGARYLDGVVQASPELVGTPDAVFLHSGPRQAFETHRTVLDHLGTVHHLGDDPGLACLYDLALLGLWYEAETAYLNALATVRASGADVEAFAAFAGGQIGHVAQAAPDTARQVKERRYPVGPAPLTVHLPVVGRLRDLRAATGMDTEPVDRLHAMIERRIARGHGAEGFTGLIEELTGQEAERRNVAPAR
ncbi:NAD(P)-dependent oxidoreductase [Thermomonospora cellulosilytica]|uniref:3-hydroxyisobutyrate dehydrogenase-like beta-hydroxyacid dehydrogenase n=1 Tax=Thermomonospora cellulosilytica TaxID=1411118 RepID=A0A7W3RBL6_9ACTN|nr:NAD(P)-binding domain-containing protein [Thermomonospora cellulosilytica]MBA9007573.1 3-hydroxyisobutyrate dehydrogenase-like beta-hydroxyacid dehydrogenase [Thermomonospora cellulosilytica]